jgi:hypothetical protein
MYKELKNVRKGKKIVAEFEILSKCLQENSKSEITTAETADQDILDSNKKC